MTKLALGERVHVEMTRAHFAVAVIALAQYSGQLEGQAEDACRLIQEQAAPVGVIVRVLQGEQP